MKKILIILSVLFPGIISAQIDTLKLSSAFTTHIIVSTDIVYADISNPKAVVAKIVEQNRNMIAMKARCEFSEASSISILDSGGKMRTYIVVYDPAPSQLVIDTREERVATGIPQKVQKGVVSKWKSGDAPTLEEVIDKKQHLFHIGEKKYDIEVICENIWSYSDITYLEISLNNKSGISYDIKNATFIIESKKNTKRTVTYDQTVNYKSCYGSLSAAPGEKSNIIYSFNKLTLSHDQVLKVYLYEIDGQRNLVMTINTKDINKAKALTPEA